MQALKGQSGPMVGKILAEAWNAQMAGEFQNSEEAGVWLSERTAPGQEFFNVNDIDQLLGS